MYTKVYSLGHQLGKTQKRDTRQHQVACAKDETWDRSTCWGNSDVSKKIPGGSYTTGNHSRKNNPPLKVENNREEKSNFKGECDPTLRGTQDVLEVFREPRANQCS